MCWLDGTELVGVLKCLSLVNGCNSLFLGVENCLLEEAHDGELIIALLEIFSVFIGVEVNEFDRGLQIVAVVLTLLIGALNNELVEFGTLVGGLGLAGFIRDRFLEVVGWLAIDGCCPILGRCSSLSG